MNTTFWLFFSYLGFILLIFSALFIYSVYRRYEWWYFPAIVIALVGAFIIDFYIVIFSPRGLHPNSGSTYEIIIPRGANLSSIGSLLKANQIIKSTGQFLWIARLLGYETVLKAGKFQFTDPYSYYQLLKNLSTISNVQVRVTIPEGLHTAQIASILMRAVGIDSTRFYALVQDSGFCSSLDIPVPNLNGFLLPETYYFYWGMDESEIIAKMVHQFKAIITDSIKIKMNESAMNLLAYVTLASIIEGEAVHDDERKTISAVFHNRLKKHIKLDADPTLQFIIPDRPRRLYNSDKLIDSPYNTYLYRGLPPGPINNPGKQSIMAAFFPDDVDYLYFVAQGNGSHIFSDRYEQHLIAKKKLDKLRKKLQEEQEN